MKKANFTRVPVISALSLLLALLLSTGNILAQPLACNDLVQVSIAPTPGACEATIYADQILEGDPIPGRDYSIEIKQGLTIIASGINEVTISDASQYLGATLTVTIEDLVTNNSCWGNMILEDKLAPVPVCTNVSIFCHEDLGAVPLPVAVDNCDTSPDVQLTNEVVNSNGLCNSGFVTITRTYVAVDNYGNVSAPCNQIITVQRPAAVDFPSDIIWHCQQYSDFPGIVAAEPLNPLVTDTNPFTLAIDVSASLPSTVLSNTGSGIVFNVVGQYCNYQTTHSDQTLQTCGNTFKIIRNWTVLDWCTGTVVTTGVGGEDNIQIIKIMDNIAPTISRAPFSVSANIPAQYPLGCRSQSFLQPPTNLSDNCTAITVKIFTPVGEAIYINGGGANGGLIPPPGLPLGTHNVTYQATDACGNQTNLVVPVTVVDDIGPTAVCDEITSVNLTQNGTAQVFAQTFDDGTHDNCCLDYFEVRRMEDNCDDGHDDTVFGPTVVFCCEDLDVNPITVVFRAFDCYGNYNDCMVIVNVNDKLEPVLQSCPNGQRITCDWYADNLETQLADLDGDPVAQSQFLDQYFGAPVFFDNCSFVLDYGIDINIDQCLEGSITRTWTAGDPSGNHSGQTCTQVVNVDHVSDWVVEFPIDITVTCGDSVPDFGEPHIFFETCELVAISYEDQIYTVVPDACYKIVRNWTIINWCVVGGNIDEEVEEQAENELGLPYPLCDLDGDGDCDDHTFRDSWRSGPAANRPTAAQATQITNPDTDPDTDPWDGYIVYEQIIKVIDDVDPLYPNGCDIPQVCIENNTCGATVLLPTPEVQDCSPNLVFDVTSGLGTGFGPFVNVAPGTYDVTYNVTDNCNNQTDCHTTVTVVDCKKPVAFCKNGLVVELDPPADTIHVTVLASDFNAGSFDNCPGDLLFSFSADTAYTQHTYYCGDVGQQTVQIWVTDASGNQDYCETFVIIQANIGQCTGDTLVVNVSGAIANQDENPVENVMVNLSGESSGAVLTNGNGLYNFANISIGNDVTVTPEKNDDPLNGVSTFDLVLITKHILGVQLLDTPYKLIAADVNNSASVTTADLVELRKLILAIIPEFSNNTSWRFVDKAYVFPETANPWAAEFPEVININDIPASVLDADFTAVKIGDVNSSANILGGAEGRNSNPFILTADDQRLAAGQDVRVEVSASDFKVPGYQFTLNFDREALDFQEMIPGVAKEENFGFTLLGEGAITTSWNGDASSEHVLFTLIFRARKSGNISDYLSLNSRFTVAEAYNLDGALMNVELTFNGQRGPDFELYQNMPNPFKNATLISFNLPEGSAGKLSICDISGRVVAQVARDFVKGYNEVIINRNELPASGVLYYTLQTATHTATRKMVVVE
jgi:hypothetical protein